VRHQQRASLWVEDKIINLYRSWTKHVANPKIHLYWRCSLSSFILL